MDKPSISSEGQERRSVYRVDHVSVSFGGVSVLEDVSTEVRKSEIAGIIGPNGSGKTTLLNVMSGFLRPQSGQLSWEGRRASRTPGQLARAGMGRTFQQPKLVDGLSAFDNVRVALDWQGRRNSFRRANDLLEQVGLDPSLVHPPVWRLTYGAKRLVDLARALATAHRILLLDEPTAGVGEEEWERVSRVVRELAAQDVAVLVTDHNLSFMRAICHRATFLHHGRVLATGPIDDLLSEPVVLAAYVGKGQASTDRFPAAAVDADVPESIEPALQVRGLSAGYRGAAALVNVSFDVRPGELVGVVGPNGAGKTTLLGALSGIVRLSEGSIRLGMLDLGQLPPAKRVAQGLAHVVEGRRIFPALTVEENLMVTYRGGRAGRTPAIGQVLEIFPALQRALLLRAATLSGGQQQMLVIARALVGAPRVLLLDEPTLGLAPLVIDTLLRTISAIAAQGVGIVITDQDAYRLARICDRCLVLAGGHVAVEGSGVEIESRLDEVERAYLGGLP